MRVPLCHANVGVAELLSDFGERQPLARPSAGGRMPQFVEGKQLSFPGLARCLHQALGAVLFPSLATIRKYKVVTAALIAHCGEELDCLRIKVHLTRFAALTVADEQSSRSDIKIGDQQLSKLTITATAE